MKYFRILAGRVLVLVGDLAEVDARLKPKFVEVVVGRLPRRRSREAPPGGVGVVQHLCSRSPCVVSKVLPQTLHVRSASVAP